MYEHIYCNDLYDITILLRNAGLDIGTGPMHVLKLSGQFGPPLKKLYWPNGPVVSIWLTTVDVSVTQPLTEK